MNALRIGGIPALLVLCAGMAVGQDAAHDVDKAATKTGHVLCMRLRKLARPRRGAPRGIALEIRLNQRRHFLQRGAGVMLEQE
jgi:hypothetical protein